jgi:hypothetical protein
MDINFFKRDITLRKKEKKGTLFYFVHLKNFISLERQG